MIVRHSCQEGGRETYNLCGVKEPSTLIYWRVVKKYLFDVFFLNII